MAKKMPELCIDLGREAIYSEDFIFLQELNTSVIFSIVTLPSHTLCNSSESLRHVHMIFEEYNSLLSVSKIGCFGVYTSL